MLRTLRSSVAILVATAALASPLAAQTVPGTPAAPAAPSASAPAPAAPVTAPVAALPSALTELGISDARLHEGRRGGQRAEGTLPGGQRFHAMLDEQSQLRMIGVEDEGALPADIVSRLVPEGVRGNAIFAEFTQLRGIGRGEEGVMLFGTDRVGKGLHAFATLAVAVGTLISAFWILAVNSWMQTPQGHVVGEGGRLLPGDWWQVIFNPSLPYRLVHMVLAAYLTTALVVGAAGAWQMLRRRATAETRTMFSMAMWMVLLVAPMQILAGDQHGLNTLEHQPVKIMAIEGHFDSHPDGAPLNLFGVPNMETGRLDHAISVPKLGSLILTHHLNTPMAGLDRVPRDQWPPVPVTFWAFRVMVGMGMAMLGLGLWSGLARWRGRLYDQRWLHRAALAMGPAGFVAVLAGWITTETGRQPWTVYGLLRTADSVSPVAAPAVGASLLAFVAVYGIVFLAGTAIMLRMMARPPLPDEHGPVRGQPQHAAGITPGGASAATSGPRVR